MTWGPGEDCNMNSNCVHDASNSCSGAVAGSTGLPKDGYSCALSEATSVNLLV